MNDDQRRKLHLLILEFSLYSVVNIPRQIQNARTVIRHFPKDIKNVPLCFLLNHALRGVFETLLNDLSQAVDLLDKALKDFGDAGGLSRTDEIEDALRMRNKLHAHRMEVSIATEQHRAWYKKKYGSFEKAFEVIEIAADQLGDAASRLTTRTGFHRKQQARMTEVPVLQPKDVDNLLSALKTAGMY